MEDTNQIVENNNTHPIVNKSKNIYKILFFIALVIIVGLLVATSLLSKNSNKSATNSFNTQTTKAEVTITPTITITNQALNYGTVEGKIEYPSDGVVSGYILAKNIKTKKIEGQFHSGGMDFSIELPEGEYFLVYRAEGNNLNVQLSHTKCGSDYSSDGCKTAESHQPLKVKVINGDKTTGINISNLVEKPDFFTK